MFGECLINKVLFIESSGSIITMNRKTEFVPGKFKYLLLEELHS